MKTDTNRKFILISFLVVLLFGVLVFGISLAPALAEDWTHDFEDLIKTNQPRLINDQATLAAEGSGAENDPEHQESTATTSTPGPAAALQTMLQDFENSTFSQAGWLHFVFYHESEVPNGVALPQNYYVDGWYLVDEAGLVSQDVGSHYDDAGNLISRGIYKDNTFINLKTNERWETEGPNKLKLDLSVIKGMLEMEMEGSILTQEVITVDGKPVISFTVIGNHETPIDLSNSSQPVKSVRKTILFDQATGAITEMETVFILIDGSEELFSRVQVTTLEWGDPTEELIQLLEGQK